MSKSTREAYGEILKTELYKNPRVVVLDADLGASTQSGKFKINAPERYFNMGIAEADMMSTAAGLATCGKIPFASTFAIFGSGRAYEQIRNSIAYPNLNVKIVVTHAGLTVGEDGATHQAIEDISLMRTIPNMTVIAPSDYNETYSAIKAAVEYEGPVYMRLGRSAVEDIHESIFEFTIGKGQIMREGTDIGIIATGIITAKALKAAEILESDGISARVINMPTIKPIDSEIIIETAKKCGKIITAEEHSIIGGLGSAVAEVLTQNYPVKQAFIGVQDTFGESGNADELLKKYGLTAENIVETAKRF